MRHFILISNPHFILNPGLLNFNFKSPIEGSQGESPRKTSKITNKCIYSSDATFISHLWRNIKRLEMPMNFETTVIRDLNYLSIERFGLYRV